jgi:hypothetical protein
VSHQKRARVGRRGREKKRKVGEIFQCSRGGDEISDSHCPYLSGTWKDISLFTSHLFLLFYIYV